MAAAAVGSRVAFFKEEGLRVEIDTDRLSIRSAQESDKGFYNALLTNIDVMTRFSDGKARTPGNIETRVNDWITRWQEGNPFSALVVSEKKLGKETPFGHIVLGYGAKAGVAELAYFLMPTHDEYEEEMVGTVIRDYAQKLQGDGYSIDGVVLQSIIASVKRTNEASNHILTKLGMTPTEQQRSSPASKSSQYSTLV